MSNTEPEVDFAAFGQEVDRVVEAAANRDAEIAAAEAQYNAFLIEVGRQRNELVDQMRRLDVRSGTARTVHQRRVAAINERFQAAGGFDDSEPF